MKCAAKTRTVFAALFMGDGMTFEELKKKAHSLPYAPGVYIMQDKSGQVIYVGKAKKLKNRVSQYFQETASHTYKTRRMVSQIFSFDTIVASSEFEALVLECSLIKRHVPRYNILLKDDKGYPYIRVDMKKPYPVMELVGRVADDGAEYFGPYGGRFISQKVMDAIRMTLKLPGCSRVFPRDIGKGRPCLNFHLGNCEGWCREEKTMMEYRALMEQAVRLLKGDYKKLASEVRTKMEEAAENLRFEEAAVLRDRLKAIDSLSQKQIVTAGTSAQTDVIGYYGSESKSCFAVLHFVDGDLLDKDYQVLPPSDDDGEAISSLVKQYYLSRGAVPKEILLPLKMEDSELFEQMLQQNYGRKVTIRVPQRGTGVKQVTLANENAREEAERVTTREERAMGTLRLLQNLLGLQEPPRRLESFDISNTAGTDIVASMVVFVDGKPSKKDYKLFQVRDLTDQDDYASMRQVVSRRFRRYLNGDPGFTELPDVLLIDGGAEHAKCAEEELEKLGVCVPVYGMVKDDRHRTRSLITSEGRELGISGTPVLFALIGRIQEEVHRFAITYHRKLQSKRVRTSMLEKIPGVGEARRKLLLKHFKTVKAVKAASLNELSDVLSPKMAETVYQYFHGEESQ